MYNKHKGKHISKSAVLWGVSTSFTLPRRRSSLIRDQFSMSDKLFKYNSEISISTQGPKRLNLFCCLTVWVH